MKKFAFSVVLSLLIVLGLSMVAVASESFPDLPWSIKAKILTIPASVATEPEMAAMMSAPVEARPTLPDGRLPQYQLKLRQRNLLSAEQRESGVVSFELAGGDHPLVIRATIHIDGEPFTASREQKKRRLVQLADNLTEEADDDVDDGSVDEIASTSYEFPASTEELIRRYVASTGGEFTSAHAEWLLNHWDLGPDFLLLKDPFQWFRSDKRPVFQVIDQDQSGVIDEAELQRAAVTLTQCDTNRDEIVDTEEIDAAVQNRVTKEKPFAKRLRLLKKTSTKPDISIVVNFDTQAPVKSTIEISDSQSLDSDRLSNVRLTDESIVFQLDSGLYEITAVQAGPSDQVSLGAVVEGYPLLSSVDPNGDQRITVRELRGLSDQLATFDEDGDGEVSGQETPPIVRVCFGLGPIVHSELIQLRSSNAEGIETELIPPKWFMRMDQNGDADLSRSEFPGTDAQFKQLDLDNDELIDISESLKSQQ